MKRTRKKVFITGCFDMLHSGHVRFVEKAAEFGDLYIGVGSDKTIKKLKGRLPIYTQEERKYMLSTLKGVKCCFVNSGSGIIDFLKELDSVKPDIFIVNEDGNTQTKSEICRNKRIKYIVLRRQPHAGFQRRSTTNLLKQCKSNIPYRLDIAGGWLDQPFISRLANGPVITICIEPTVEFNQRSGMATSTRHRAIELWKADVPPGDIKKLAYLLFCFDNPPEALFFSGSQDAIGIIYPGLNRLDYSGDYWPDNITRIDKEPILSWLEQCLHLIPLKVRKSDFAPFSGKKVAFSRVHSLAHAAHQCWNAILDKNIVKFAKYVRASFEAQVSMFPAMVTSEVRGAIGLYSKSALGWKLAGSGGGGYLVLVNEKPVEGAIKVKIRRKAMAF